MWGSTAKKYLKLSPSSLVVPGWFSSFSLRGKDKAKVSDLGLVQFIYYIWGHYCIMLGSLEVSNSDPATLVHKVNFLLIRGSTRSPLSSLLPPGLACL